MLSLNIKKRVCLLRLLESRSSSSKIHHASLLFLASRFSAGGPAVTDDGVMMALGCSDLYIGTSATVLLELLQNAPLVATTTITPSASSQASASTIGASSVSRAQSVVSDSQTVTTGTVSTPSDSESVPPGSQATTASIGPDSGTSTSLLASTGSHPTAASTAGTTGSQPALITGF